MSTLLPNTTCMFPSSPARAMNMTVVLPGVLRDSATQAIPWFHIGCKVNIFPASNSAISRSRAKPATANELDNLYFSCCLASDPEI